MTRKHKKRKPKLNKDLCPTGFEIYVPKGSRLLGHDDWYSQDKWEEYVQRLTRDYELPSDYTSKTGWSCDCKESWLLRGDLAIAHACQVHERVHRQILGFEQVSAIDVGFAIWERQTEFENFLAIRIHVNKKQPPEQLLLEGLPSFTPQVFALPRFNSGFQTHGHPGDFHPDEHCRKRWKWLKPLLERELQRKKELWDVIDQYPVSGVRWEDLSLFCPESIEDYCELGRIRLCVCGVPIDIINARYNPSAVTHPGGDADSGVFVDPPQRSDELGNEEQLLIGRGRVNPLVGGVSVGSVTGQAGTLGAVVWDRTDGTPCVLSNWHVLAGTASAQVGQPTYQPALFDGGTEDDVVAYLKRWHVGEEGDAAIAELSGDRDYASGEVLGLWHPISGYQAPKLNMEIRKWGRTTGFTQGFVDGIHLATNIDYGGGVVRYFKNQFHIAPLFECADVSQVGDSGSFVVTSFRPQDLEDRIKNLSIWLRQSCLAQCSDYLCDDIRATLEEQLTKCKDLKCHGDYCKILAKACTDLGKLCRDHSAETRELCNEISRWRDKLRAEQKPILDQVSFCTRVDSTFGRWHCECAASPCNPCPRIIKGIDLLINDCKSFECMCSEQICEALKCARDDLESKCEDERDFEEWKNELCEEIENQRRKIATACSCTHDCASLYEETDGFFKKWYDRCIGERLCKALQGICSEEKCKHPEALVKCIEEELCRDSASGYSYSDLLSAHEKKAIMKVLRPLVQAAGGHLRVSLDMFEGTRLFSDYERTTIRKLVRSLIHGTGHDPDTFLKALKGTARRYYRRKEEEGDRTTSRVYYAVGMLFAGDTPGSPFGEFAVASDIERLADELRFSLRPVFEPRSSFRELRQRPPSRRQRRRALRSRRGLAPGTQSGDPRGGGPQPDIEPGQPDPDDAGGG